MPARYVASLVAFALAVAACGEPAPGPIQGDGEGVLLSYGYQPGQNLSYRFESSTDMSMELNGLDDVPGGSIEGPIEMALDVSGKTSYLVADGPEPGTVRVTLRHELTDANFSKFSVGGQSQLGLVGPGIADEFAEQQAYLPEATMVLDERGNVLSFEIGGHELPVDFLGGDLFGGLDPTGGQMALDGFLGPAFPAEELWVGGTWTIDSTRDIPLFGKVGTRADYEVVAEEELQGRRTFLIRSHITLDAIEVDFVEMFRELLEADPEDLAAFGISPGELPDLEGAMAGFNMGMVIDPSSTRGMVWFDPDNGIVVRAQSTSEVTMSIDVDAADLFGSVSMTSAISATNTIHLLEGEQA